MECLTLVTENAVIACLIFYAVSKIIIKFMKSRSFDNRCSKFEGPPRLPIIGNAYLFIGSAKAIMNRFIELDKTYPDYYQVALGSHPVFVTAVPEHLKIIFQSPKTIDRGSMLKFIQPWFGSGILLATAPKWQMHRKLIQPAFNSMILKSFVGLFASQSAIMVQRMERHLNGAEFKVHKYLAPCMLDIVCGTTLGVNLETQDDCHFAKLVEKVTDIICTRVLRPWLHPDFIFYRTKLGRDQQKQIQLLHEFVENVIEKKKKQMQEPCSRVESADYEQDKYNPKAGGNAFLDRMLSLSNTNEALTDEELRDEVHSIVMPGSDAPANILSFVMLMLAYHPDVQDKVYEELYEIYGDNNNGDQLVTPEHLMRMIYLERVIKESMRLFPGSPFLFREVKDDLDIGDRVLPKGSSVAPNILGLHRSEKYWPDPLKFDPDRFFPEQFAKQHPYSYVPFGAGPRNCLGSKYGMMLMKTSLATILRQYVLKKDRILRVENVQLKMEMLLRPAEPITIRIENRTPVPRSFGVSVAGKDAPED